MLEAITFLLFEESEYNAEFDENGRIIESTRDKTHLNFYSVTEKMHRLQYPPHGSQQPDGFFLERGEHEDEAAFRARQDAAFLCPLDKDFLELKRRKPDSLAYRLYCEVRNAPEETGQSFLSSANVKTFMFNMENMKNLTSSDTIALEKLGNRKTALFLLLSATDRTYNFMPAMLYTQLFDVLSIQASFRHGGTLPVPVRCIMDEFANVAQIPNFDQIIAIIRSWGISVSVILQNMSQLKSRYKDTWESIVGCCDSMLFLGGKEESTLKYISEALGKETIDVRGHNKTKGKQPSTSENNSIMGRELMQPNEIAVMPITDCILMIRGKNPMYCRKYDLQKHINYRFIEDYDKANAFDVHTIRSVSVEEVMQETDAVSTETEEQPESLNILFKREPVPLIYETYADAALYGEHTLTEIDEEYPDESPKYGRFSDDKTFDLGEPVREPRKEVMPYEDGERTVDDECRYAVPDEAVQHIGTIDAADVESAVVEMTAGYAEMISSDYLKEAFQYDLDARDEEFPIH